VLKADGLAAGKGVIVCRTDTELEQALRGTPVDRTMLVEELLDGPEVSILALCDGQEAIALAPARDYKRALDGDEGPNTGGMGSFAPVAVDRDESELVEKCIRPVLDELAGRGSPFVGTLFAGLMLTSDGPRVLEYNCRFGDPETQSVLPLVDGDLLEPLAAAATGSLGGTSLDRQEGAAVTVIVTAGDYPASGDRGTPIEGIEQAEASGALVFHAGTALRDGQLVTNGGRLVGVTATGATVSAARERAYAASDLIRIDGCRRRGDIALGVEDA
jgi:phosphoribosylamine--glycine ligase